eukprot:PhM_4_TR6223/c0_g1_i1/m.93378/K14938/NVD, DAF36; cholesterol 7-desaturase
MVFTTTTNLFDHVSGSITTLRDSSVVGEVLCWSVLVVVVYGVYRYIFRDYDKQRVSHWSPHSARFNKRRLAQYPAPYPNGWYRLCSVDDIKNGRVHSVTALGQDLIVFWSKKKKQPVIMDAFCPHLGAHLGVGGTVTDDGVVCPFHGWCLDAEGKVSHIPYCEGAKPKGKVTRVHRHKVWMGLVMFWFHCDNFSEEAREAIKAGEDGEIVPPEWELSDPVSDPAAKNWTRFACIQAIHNHHILEIAHNAPDYYHFNYLHRTYDFHWSINWLTDRLLKLDHVTKFYGRDEIGKHHRFFDNDTTTAVLGWRLGCITQLTVVDLEGPSIIHFHIVTPVGAVHLVKTLLPIDHFKQHVEDAWFRDDRTPLWLCHAIAFIAKKALGQDLPIWNSKEFMNKPLLVKGDGPFVQFKQWYSTTFYSENSMDYAKENAVDRMAW